MSVSRNDAQKITSRPRVNLGFTLIELMIVVAILAVLLAIALPVYSNYVIRTKIAEGLSVANAAKTAVGATCIEKPSLTGLNNSAAGYEFETGTDANDYVEDVQTNGDCSAPLITITTRNTGQAPDPIVTLQGVLTAEEGQMRWNCFSDNTPNWLLPKPCRS